MVCARAPSVGPLVRTRALGRERGRCAQQARASPALVRSPRRALGREALRRDAALREYRRARGGERLGSCAPPASGVTFHPRFCVQRLSSVLRLDVHLMRHEKIILCRCLVVLKMTSFIRSLPRLGGEGVLCHLPPRAGPGRMEAAGGSAPLPASPPGPRGVTPRARPHAKRALGHLAVCARAGRRACGMRGVPRAGSAQGWGGREPV